MNPNNISICHFDPVQVPVRTLLDVFYRSVHAIPDAIYSHEQKSVWAPDCMDVSAWKKRIAENDVWVALDDKNKECLGFIELNNNGDIESLFVCPRAQRHGIAKMLLVTAYESLNLKWPKKSTWEVGASDAAYDFFLKQGFLPTKRNQFERFGITLENTQMAKSMSLEC